MQAWPWLWNRPNALPAVDRGVEIGVVEHDVGALAAELELELLEVAGRGLDDPATGGGRAGERQLGDAVVLGEPLAGGGAVTGDDVDHAGREADLADQLGDGERAERRELGGLEHDGVAGGERGAELPAGEHQREVPRHDLTDHADRLALDEVEEAGVDRDHRALDLVGHAAEVAEAERGARDVEVGAVADRVAGVAGLELGEPGGVGLDRAGEREQQATALAGRGPAPRRERAPCSVDRAIDVLGAGLGDVGQLRLVERVEYLDRAAGEAVDELAADEQLGLHLWLLALDHR
jgi:hypothetical protein